MNSLFKGWDYFEVHVIEVVGALLLLAGTLLMFVEVVGRNVFAYSISGVDEIIRYAMIWGVYLVLGVTLKREINVKLQLLTSHLSRKPLLVVDTLTTLVSMAFFAVLLWYGLALVGQQRLAGTRSVTSLATPLWLVHLSVPVGSALFLVRGIERVYLNLAELLGYGGHDLVKKIEVVGDGGLIHGFSGDGAAPPRNLKGGGAA